MSDFNKSYRIRTEVGKDTQLHVKLDSSYDILELMSMKINQENIYRFHSANYGVIAGRVLANEAFGIPNAKISVFIDRDEVGAMDSVITEVLYPYNSTLSKNFDNVRYNLLPNEQVSNCHTVIGTFPEKQYMLDNDNILEVFDKYFKFTTRTNNAGDYMIFGVPTGSQTIHVDIDLSDIGILSQKPRDMVYKGYNIEQFENPNKFKYDTNLNSLTQVVSQDNVTEVIPFWGNEEEDTIGITRCDINVQYKFEPTCVFIGSVVSDTNSNGISQKCIPTPGMGAMDEITTGSGTIEMIRKTYSGDVEEFQIQGTQLINGDGVWCYQIPMNLDYMMTDEYGNMVPTNNPNKGIPTRTRVRFRISLHDMETDNANIHRCKILVPHNPNVYSDTCQDDLDYQFGTNTKEDSYRDLYWNGVYSVKSYIPRIQKGSNWKNDKFTGFKRVNYYGEKNPIPYNNIRIRLPFTYTLLCSLIKTSITLSSFLNKTFKLCGASFVGVTTNEVTQEGNSEDGESTSPFTSSGAYVGISGEICDENLDFLCIIPGIDIDDVIKKNKRHPRTLLAGTILKHYENIGGDIETIVNQITTNNEIKEDARDSVRSLTESTMDIVDSQSIDYKNANHNFTNPSVDDIKITGAVVGEGGDKKDAYDTIKITGIRLTDKIDYFIQCIELKLAQEMKVIQFDFYNDWINGLIYIPRWMRNITKKKTYLWGAVKFDGKVKACNENYKTGYRNLVQQCGLDYFDEYDNIERIHHYQQVKNNIGCSDSGLKCHKSANVRKTFGIFNSSGLIHTVETIKKQYVYYLKPYEYSNGKNVRLFATDIILLGSLNECDKWGIPNILTELQPTTYQMPPNLALTDSDIEGKEREIFSGGSIYIDMWRKNMTCRSLWLDKNILLTEEAFEGGNYTEISGIDWGYTGPLQTYTKLQGKINDYNDKHSRKAQLRKTGFDGTLQTRINFYKPGGHFLGISCRNAETNIKTCVNLSRICEQGVWMSQRQVLNVPDNQYTMVTLPTKQQAFKNYATIPSGFISKDEISGTSYRCLFASMNKNRLRTTIDIQTGYPVYNFEYINPTNFSGELERRIFGTHKEDMNHYYSEPIKEKYFDYKDDDYRKRENERNQTENEVQVMRTGEYRDIEYIKFRFGYNSKEFESDSGKIKDDALSKRFLIEDTTNYTNTVSFPIYDNSFYFYFGLHDGKTALDEFKKTYYAVCPKNNLLEVINKNDIELINKGTKYDGIYKYHPGGEINFSIKTDAKETFSINNRLYIRLRNRGYTPYPDGKKPNKNDGYINISEIAKQFFIKIGETNDFVCLSDAMYGLEHEYVNDFVFSEDDRTILEIRRNDCRTFYIQGLLAGSYIIEVTTGSELESSLGFTIKRQEVSGVVLGRDFLTYVSNNEYDTNPNNFYDNNFLSDKLKNGGYIYIDKNQLKLNLEDNDTREISIFVKDETVEVDGEVYELWKVNEYIYQFIIECKPIINTIETPFNIICYINNTLKDVVQVTDEKLENNPVASVKKINDSIYAIPVPFINTKYEVYASVYYWDYGKIPEDIKDTVSKQTYKWYIGEVEIGTVSKMSVTYKGISAKTLMDVYDKKPDANNNILRWWENIEDFKNSEGLEALWKLKNNLFSDGDNTHNVSIGITGGTPPYKIKLKRGENSSELTTTSLPCTPTINTKDESNSNYLLQITDNNEINAFEVSPEDTSKDIFKNAFEFPVIYRPFFMQTILLHHPGSYTYLHGCSNVYNGKTYFNDFTTLKESKDIRDESDKEFIFNICEINNKKIFNTENSTDQVEVINPNTDDFTLEINEYDIKEKGGYNYHGEYNKYNARKVQKRFKIDKSRINWQGLDKYDDISVEIGSNITLKNGTTYSDTTHIRRNDMKFGSFSLTLTSDKKGRTINFSENPSDYALFYILYDYKIDSGFNNIHYPINGVNGNPTASAEYILRKLVNIIDSDVELDTIGPDNEIYINALTDRTLDKELYPRLKLGDTITFADFKNNEKENLLLYFIAVPLNILKNDKKGVKDNSNDYNLLLPVTVSYKIILKNGTID